MMNDAEIFYPETPSDWRKWLEQNHISKQSVWLVFYNKKAKKKSITWSESVDQALCFGWIDSKKIKIDDEQSHQFFSRRKPQSTWSRINKEKIDRLTEAGLMTEAGLKSVALAKQNGSWNILDEVEELSIPKDLALALKRHKGANEYFQTLSKSNKKILLSWIVLAKRPETRAKRIQEIAESAAQQRRPKQFA